MQCQAVEAAENDIGKECERECHRPKIGQGTVEDHNNNLNISHGWTRQDSM